MSSVERSVEREAEARHYRHIRTLNHPSSQMGNLTEIGQENRLLACIYLDPAFTLVPEG